ncbi:hypothetical protein JTE90_026966 [Oedothorax gibbosus]|uniref:Uncharacterized protein n=1 Tax=Oedothorax gibbosus TaxID=931172 RepID=A0AAV6UXH6_9ARAC|nr:hypothetical protein JTE90_026966 [Oedothorax gibbosus]
MSSAGGTTNREETIPMLMLNHSDSREDSLPRNNSSTRIEILPSTSAPHSPPTKDAGANCTRNPSNGVPSPAGSQRPAYTNQPQALNLMQFVEPPPGGPSPPKTPSPASVAAAEA